MINWLHDLRASHAKFVGSKAANLGELISININVPMGFVFSDPSPMGYEAVRLAYTSQLGGKVAVRSSSTEEDTLGSSFAGLYETYLNIEGEWNVCDAVAKCIESAFKPRVISYKKSMGFDPKSLDMSVIVQKMVEAEFAGVIFTKNPVNNNNSEIMIESVRGLGEQLVSGSVTPESYLIDKETGNTIKEPDEGMLHASHLERLIDVTSKIEEHFKKPQDIEWVILNGDIVITQTRPITT